MSVVVLDTDAASVLHRGGLYPEYARHLVGNTLALTFVTVGELHKGMALRRWGERRRADLVAWIDRFLVLPYSQDVARRWASWRPALGSIERTPAGTWKARYGDPQGRSRRKTFKRKRDAEMFLASAEVDMRRGEWGRPERWAHAVLRLGRGVDVKPPPILKQEMRSLSAVEVRELAEAIPPWFRTWVYFAAYTGLRWSEMLGLRRKDVDLLRGHVRVSTIRFRVQISTGRSGTPDANVVDGVPSEGT